jgi:hypothetical protein
MGGRSDVSDETDMSDKTDATPDFCRMSRRMKPAELCRWARHADPALTIGTQGTGF